MENSFLLTSFEIVDAAWLDAHPGVKVLGSPTTGLDHIDLAECARRGVKVVSLQGERRFLKNITSTAEHTMGLTLALARNYKAAGRGERIMGHKLAGSTLGIIGHRGRIGRQMRKIARGFGMKVMGADRGDELLELLRRSDIVTLHLPLLGNEGYWKLFHFKQMKPTAFFVNTSRSKIVAPGALLEALKSGIIKGAAVDFTDDPELVAYARDHDNLILTNHCGGNTVEDRIATDAYIISKMKLAAK